MFLEEALEGVAVTILADTSASMLVLSSQLYQEISERRQPALRGWWCTNQRGNDFFVLTVGPLTLEKELVVAEIVDDALIGYGLLAGGECGPVDVLLSKNVIYI